MVNVSQCIENGDAVLKESLEEIGSILDENGRLMPRTRNNVDILAKVRLNLDSWCNTAVKMIEQLSTDDYESSVEYRNELNSVLLMALDSCNPDITKIPVNYYVQITRSVSGLIGILKGISEYNKVMNIVGPSVFVVHGHDDQLRKEVCEYLTYLDKTPIVLSEKVNKGRFILEKFIDESSKCGFAVILMTADDIGREKDSEKSDMRARQNVIFEYGYFIAKLGKENICVIKDEEVDFLSDVKGIAYSNSNDWKTDLKREIDDWSSRLIE